MIEATIIGDCTLYRGDNRDVLRQLEDNSLDSCVTDPPYHLQSIVKRFAASPRNERTENPATPYGRTSVGFMGKAWDGGDIAFTVDFWAEVFRVLKPGAFVAAFGASRGYHRMACAIEDAGFEIRDSLMWIYGTGFPKSHDVSKGIDKAAGAERTVSLGVKPGHEGFANRGNMSSVQSFQGTMGGEGGFSRPWMDDPEAVERYHQKFAPATDTAREWEGWGTALKPAFEPIVLARKPLSEPTVAANVLRWRTGALNIDGCRVEAPDGLSSGGVNQHEGTGWGFGDVRSKPHVLGRWPANILHDGSDEVVSMFPTTTPAKAGKPRQGKSGDGYGMMHTGAEYNDNGGSAARFFYTSKADKQDRMGSKHPTVKPVDLMQWLCRLITPPGGTVLDPFAGSGSTGEAAWREGFNAILCEREEEYQADIAERLRLANAGPMERRARAIKQADTLGLLFGDNDNTQAGG